MALDSLQILALAAEHVQKQTESEQFGVRKARYTDIPLLAQVERSAAELFISVGRGYLVDNRTVDPALLSDMASANHLWVAVNTFDQPIGFCGGEWVDGNFHIVEISVAKAWQGKGIGRVLMGVVEDQLRREGYRSVTLTTYRDLPWNAPFYASMGYFEVMAQELGRTYEEIVLMEAQHGLEVKSRCVMKKII
jgi:GNAT superfamily N-acetyltransferase